MEDSRPASRVRRVRHEPRRRELAVLRAEPLSPGFVAVTLGGADLHDFTSDSFDDHVKLFFEGGGQARRDFTPRRFDRERGELTLEFALHDAGPATDWARRVAAGGKLLVGGPRGSLVVPTDYDWHLLVGDASALPAIRRRLEELPAGTRAIVVAQLNAADRLPLPTAARLDLRWVDDGEALVGAVRALTLPPGEGYAWAAGEASAMKSVRAELVAKGHPKEGMRVAAYWKLGTAEHHEDLQD